MAVVISPRVDIFLEPEMYVQTLEGLLSSIRRRGKVLVYPTPRLEQIVQRGAETSDVAFLLILDTVRKCLPLLNKHDIIVFVPELVRIIREPFKLKHGSAQYIITLLPSLVDTTVLVEPTILQSFLKKLLEKYNISLSEETVLKNVPREENKILLTQTLFLPENRILVTASSLRDIRDFLTQRGVSEKVVEKMKEELSEMLLKELRPMTLELLQIFDKLLRDVSDILGKWYRLGISERTLPSLS